MKAMINPEILAVIMDSQDWNRIARQAFATSDGNSPSACYIDDQNEVAIAETMVEIQGLPIAFAYEGDPKFCFNPTIETLCWDQAQVAISAFKAECNRLSSFPIRT